MACPCAGCIDEFTRRRILTEEMVDEGVYPTTIEYVGRYALQFFWSDGHGTGIYPYDFLRGPCGCSICSSQGEHEYPPGLVLHHLPQLLEEVLDEDERRWLSRPRAELDIEPVWILHMQAGIDVLMGGEAVRPQLLTN